MQPNFKPHRTSPRVSFDPRLVCGASSAQAAQERSCKTSGQAPSRAATWAPALVLALAALQPAISQAQVEVPAPKAADATEDVRYLLGASYRYGPEYFGARNYKGDIKPLWAVRWGRWRIATSGSSGLMGFGRETMDGGAGA